MLDSLPKVAEFLLWNNASLLPEITTAPPLRPGNMPVTPQDPSTLALAIVGIVTLAVYFAVSGWRKSRSEAVPTSRPRVDVAGRSPSTDHTDAATRDAA